MEEWEELEDVIADAIADSLDADWTARTGARYAVEALKEREQKKRDSRVCGVCAATGGNDHAGYCSENW